MVDNNTVVEVEDTGSYSGKEKSKSFRSIVLDQVTVCTQEGSKEMSLGGVRKRVVDGQVVELPVPNQIELFCNSVDMLKHLLYPQIIKLSGFIGKEINAFEDDLVSIANERKRRLDRLDLMIRKSSQHIRGYEEESQKTKLIRYKPRALQMIRVDTEYKRYSKYKDLFAHLSKLLAKLNYFEEGS